MYAIFEEPGNCTKRAVLECFTRQNARPPASHRQTFAHRANQIPTDQADDKVLTPCLGTCDNITEQIEDFMARQNRRGSSRPGHLIRKSTLASRASSSLPLEILALLLTLVCVIVPRAVAQTPDADDIHVTPRVEPDQPDEQNVLSAATVRTHSPLT